MTGKDMMEFYFAGIQGIHVFVITLWLTPQSGQKILGQSDTN